jgi:Short C-terminal domain
MGTNVMSFLSERGQSIVREAAARHGVSIDAATLLLRALADGHGNQAQFSHPDLGGMGQWSRGGMIMVGDMFNNALKARVDALCTELSDHLRTDEMFARPQAAPGQSQSQSSGSQGVSLFVSGSRSGNWWPDGLGAPSSVGSQNSLRYAFFPDARRLAIDIGGKIAVHDTGDHQIGGFSQQQSGDQTLTFTSQHGIVRVSDLPRVDQVMPSQETRAASEGHEAIPIPGEAVGSGAEAGAGSAAHPAPPAPSARTEMDIFAQIERLASLLQKGILTQSEFDAKKAELLARI